MPRARGIYLYSPDAELVWSADGTDFFDLRPTIEQQLEDARLQGQTATTGLQRMIDDTPAYCFLLRDEVGVVLGALAVLCRPLTGASGSASFDSIERTLAPVLELTRQSLGHARIQESGRFNIVDTQELQWLLDVTQVDAPAGPSSEALQALLDAYAERAGCDFVLLHVPDRRLERRSSRAALPTVELEQLRDVVQRHLYRVAQLQQRTLIVNKVRENSAGLIPFRILCVPLVRRGQVAGVVVGCNRVSSSPFAKREAKMLERLAPRLMELVDLRFDGATGLLTRHAFDEQVRDLLARAEPSARCVVYCNVDQLHGINELYGLEAGDAVLAAVGEAWRVQQLPGESAVARHASDRFVALLDVNGLDAGRAWAERARQTIAALALPDPYSCITVSASVGVAMLPPGAALEHALVGAESACKQAKDHGRNRVETRSSVAGRAAQQQRELRLRREMLSALEQGRLQLYAQPLTPLWDTTRPQRFEVFARLLDSRRQPVPASNFLAVAERHQLLAGVDRWVLGELIACLTTRGALAANGVVFSLNISAQSLREGRLAAEAGERLHAAGLPPSLFSFELSEHVMVANLPETERFIGAVTNLGCGVSIDDFGAGRSSLIDLSTLRINALKIDGAFIKELTSNARAESMVRAILQVARQLGIDTVAECVETRAVAEQLSILGVTYGQGNVFAPPRALTEVLDELDRRVAPRLTDAVAASGPGKRVH